MCFNVKSLTYYFYMKTDILADFQVSISVQLKQEALRTGITFLTKFSYIENLKTMQRIS